MHRGYIKLFRKILEWDWYKCSDTKAVFLHLLLTANHKTTYYMGHEIKRGELVCGRKQLSIETGISEQSLRTSIERLKSTSEITSKSTNKFSIITLCNYEAYQTTPNENNQQNVSPVTNNQPATNQQLTTSKELKNERREEINTVVCFLNSTSGTEFRTGTKNTVAHINARLAEGFTVDDFKAVISYKHKEWGNDSNMKQYLRPDTLFGPKFEGYLQAANLEKTKNKPQTIPEYAQKILERNRKFDEEAAYERTYGKPMPQ